MTWTKASGRRRWLKAARALEHRAFRLYFVGQIVSIMGTWVQQVAMGWLVYRLTGSAELLGITTFLTMAPQMVVGPLMGALFDRFDRRRLLLVVQCLLILHGSILGLLTLGGFVTPGLIVFMAALLGVLNGIDTPLRQSLIGGLLEDSSVIHNAFALNAMAFNAGRFLGPPIAGVFLSLTSEGVCFLVNGLSYLALVIALLRIKTRPPSPPDRTRSYLSALGEGFAEIWWRDTHRGLLLLVGGLNLTASSYAVLMPVFVKEVFLADAQTLGWLLGAAGAGAVLATILLATLQGTGRVIRLMLCGVIGAALALLIFSTTAHLGVALAAMVVLGFGISVTNVGTNATLQSISADKIRGRVASFFSATRFGFDALGGLAAGYLAKSLGASTTLLVEGGGLVLLMALLMPRLWRLTRRM
ncbi:MAG: MFS transporter [Rhodospirillum sp.]|nr:MFS transporter [Rhodospirillum sp.]MCF8491298.1 MFS transporter [Rhodospirillum sp.]